MADMEPENEVPLLLGQLEEAHSYQEEESKVDEVGVESLDYEPIHSLVYAQTKKGSQQRKIYGWDLHNFFSFTYSYLEFSDKIGGIHAMLSR